MTIRTALAQGTELLAQAGVGAARLNAEVLLAHAFHRDRTYFYAHPEQELREVEWIHYGRYLHERMQGKPTQYITGKQEFYGRDFRVTPAVLIPRPETELLVETVLRLQPRCLVDVGTGSGAIAITLKLECPALRVYATDISADALQVARANARNLQADVQFFEGDLLTAFGCGIADAVVSNPPYVPLADRDTLQREVRDWEPHLALFAGASGTDVYRRLLPQAMRVLAPGGLLALELGYGLAGEATALASEWHDIQVLPDLAGVPRVLTCRAPGLPQKARAGSYNADPHR
ncbi:MAG: peptide chain release factor N(5)-glutamine methyltransferase [Terriglobia bacterium]